MTRFPPNCIIKIVREKKLQNKPSKGRNQWMFLKKFGGRSIADFFGAAAASTRNSPRETYQNGAWWERELEWNLERGNVEIVGSPAEPTALAGSSPQPAPEPPAKAAADPGLYVVTLNNCEPISANAHDPRNADTSVMVNKDNCKFGKAQSLAARRNNYITTFGEGNVNFMPIATVGAEYLARAERVVSDSLRERRIPGPSGRLTEWMAGIRIAQVVELVFRQLEKYGIPYRSLC